VQALLRVVDRLDASNALAEAIARQDAVTAQHLVQRALLGDPP
jgi:xylose isomerase